jgi:phytoene synthase
MMHSSTTQKWESALLSLATEALHLHTHEQSRTPADQSRLDEAHAHCNTLTAIHSRSFHMASSLLPKEKRRAARALYAFCRTCDDIVDRPLDAAHVSTSAGRLADEELAGVQAMIQANLAEWRQQTHHQAADETDLVALAWNHTRRHYSIPLRYAEQLIDGVAQDMVKDRYDTFEELAAYSYGVASTVGLMSMHIIGFDGPEAVPFAIKLGVALQMTNILRDVGEDWRAGRLYLPLDELAEFGLSEEDIAAGVEDGVIDERWRNFMRFQIQRNHRLYEEAWPGIAMLNRDGRFAIAAAAELYRGILADIERHDYDNFTRRARVTTSGKLVKLPGIWWRSRTV